MDNRYQSGERTEGVVQAELWPSMGKVLGLISGALRKEKEEI